ncbi:MAG: sulfate reduction electron transfer complex DsrMKJOP subunit DsrM [bacterium]|nr:sulfate reduction electron transfer complex DsrMKJOP subunit DsrM [bacterium]
MKVLLSLLSVLIVAFIAFIGVEVFDLSVLFGIILPYAGLIIFTIGIIWKVIGWAKSPVPFCIPTTGGQQKSFPWVKHNSLENPANRLGVLGRMALEIFFFRSLLRNTKTELKDNHLAQGSTIILWLSGIAFHYSMLIVILRHLRLFIEPTLPFLSLIEGLDGFLQVGSPTLYLTGVILLLSGIYLLSRRVFLSQIRYISLPADYFILFLIIGIALSGILLRYFFKTDVTSIKGFMVGMLSFNPGPGQNIGSLFYIHLTLVSLLLAYLPFSKVVHSVGVLFSPTRNLANNSRIKRHINPWDYPVKVHSYLQYEEEFREKMKATGIPVETA